MIDLHTHTTASDGRCSPAELVERASRAGVTVLSVTDHDTSAGCEAAAAACAAAKIEFVPGVEITAVEDGADVHVLGYFIDTGSVRLQTFLADQRRQRVDRLREMVERLRTLGMPLDADAILQPGLDTPGKAPGRPWIARALVANGYVRTSDEAFARWLGHGRPAFVCRVGASAAVVFASIHEARGIASLAHPVLVEHDEWIPRFAEAGLDALEAYHSDHDATATAHYLRMAERLNLAVSGGLDYHADTSHGPGGPGYVALPRKEYERLRQRRPAA